jgi:hypothetical protein
LKKIEKIEVYSDYNDVIISNIKIKEKVKDVEFKKEEKKIQAFPAPQADMPFAEFIEFFIEFYGYLIL